jgi:hypothetical protein
MELGQEKVLIDLHKLSKHPNSNFEYGADGRNIPHLFQALRAVSFGKTSNRR